MKSCLIPNARLYQYAYSGGPVMLVHEANYAVVWNQN
jgi:hypothetical protein